jgi:hypothetical protein
MKEQSKAEKYGKQITVLNNRHIRSNSVSSLIIQQRVVYDFTLI